ncbi:MAG: AAA family ATPase [Bacteroidia bacterium]|nr:AAA family ATPase [Bacteroidia bacterium]
MIEMIESLTIYNFGPIKSATLSINKYSVFIGPQASGKSTVAKLLSIFRDLEFLIDENRDFKKILGDYNIGNYLHENTLIEYDSHNTKISYFDSELKVKIKDDFGKVIESEKQRVEKFITEFVETRQLAPDATTSKDTINKLYDSSWKRLFSINTEQVYIPAERMLLSLVSENPFSLFKNFALPNCITQFGLKYEEAKNRLSEFKIDFLNVTFKNEDGKQRLYLDNNASIDLSESASGFQSIIPSILVLESESRTRDNSSFIIEEPELNLYPSTQKNFMSFLISKVTSQHHINSNRNLIVTTHSPYILSILNNFMFAYFVFTKQQSMRQGIEPIIPMNNWINPEHFSAFHFANGEVKSIIDPKTKLIYENELDNISIDLKGERDQLLGLYKQVL